MNTPRLKLSVLALISLSIHVHANQALPMVGEPVQHVSSKAALESGAVPPADSARSGASSTLSVTSVVAETATTATTTDTEASNPVIERLTVQAGQRLSVALGTWLKPQKIELSWEAPGSLPGRMRDVVLDSTWTATQTSLIPTLREVLAPFGLEAHVLAQDTTPGSQPRAVVVRNASGARP